MTPEELRALPLARLAAGLRSGHFSSEAVTRAYLDRIEAFSPKLNAVVHLRREAALLEARAADGVSPAARGALHGVPVTIKDSLDTAGIVTTGGTKGRAGFVPGADATVVRRLREAGAIVMGKTNTPDLTLGYETTNLVYGRTNNPFDPERTSWSPRGRRRPRSSARWAPWSGEAAGRDPWGRSRTRSGSTRGTCLFSTATEGRPYRGSSSAGAARSRPSASGSAR